MEEHNKEHPNPAWARRAWVSLDGVWRVERRGKAKEIAVPFPVGSPASGVDFPDSGTFIYTRGFDVTGDPGRDRFILNIGAADYETKVFVNGEAVGRHVGGYASFRFDITDKIVPCGNRLKIVVRDSHNPGQVRGKQTFLRKPFAVWYSGYAGIWQSVWIERTGFLRIASARVDADFGARRIRVSAELAAAEKADASSVRLFFEIGTPAGARLSYEADRCGAGVSFERTIPFGEIGEFLWSPENPNMYRITYRLACGENELDLVDSYFGIRRIEARDGGLFLNGEPVFLRMALVQGYYPEGGYTPKSASAMEDDLIALKKMGFNGARIHEKIESPRFHHLCDRLGLLTTFEMPSFYRPSRKAFDAYESELGEIIARDAMHPSAIAWILFNETWGVWGMYRAASATRRFIERMLGIVREKDPGRPVIENSGWEHFDTDIVDFHHYLGTAELARDAYRRLKLRDPGMMRGISRKAVLSFYAGNGVTTRTRTLFLDSEAERTAAERRAPWFLSEYGGFGWYESAESCSVEEKIERYTKDIVDSGLFCGYCLTQLYDVGNETNGLLSFDRGEKVDVARMRSINSDSGDQKPKSVERVTDDDYPRRDDGDEDHEESCLDHFLQHDDRGQRERGNGHHEG